MKKVLTFLVLFTLAMVVPVLSATIVYTATPTSDTVTAMFAYLPKAQSYDVYVDNNTYCFSLYEDAVTTKEGTTVSCNGPILSAGPHVVHVIAVVNGLNSGRSDYLVVEKPAPELGEPDLLKVMLEWEGGSDSIDKELE